MNKISLVIAPILLLSCISSCVNAAHEDLDGYLKKSTLQTGITIVVAEGKFEPRSIGSYSIRAYEANSDYPTDYFLTGLIRSRDGYIEKVVVQDINGDHREEIIIIIRSAGTGSAISADVFQYQPEGFELIVSVDELGKNKDPILELTNKLAINKSEKNNDEKE